MGQHHRERDAEIVRRYVDEGATQDQLSDDFHISKQRIQQILKAAGINRGDNPRYREYKYDFVGINVTRTTKEELKRRAAQEKKSVSALVNEWIEEDLRKGA